MRRASDIRRAHAWVESPLQLVNVVERSAALDQPTDVHLRSSSRELISLAGALSDSLPETVRVVGESRVPPAAFVAASSRVIGDTFSGQVRAILATTGARNLALVDDGSSTLHLARVLGDTSRRFGRMARSESRAARTLGALARRRILGGARRGQVSLFTAYGAVPHVRALADAGLRVEHNDYAWLREAAGGSVGVEGSAVILGSALHVDGMVHEDAYAAWLARASAPRAVYLPHRREPQELRERWQRELGLQVVDHGLPAELVLAASPSVQTIATLPTSAVATLRTLLPGSISITVDPVEESWWTSSADAGIREAFAELRSMEVPGDDSH